MFCDKTRNEYDAEQVAEGVLRCPGCGDVFDEDTMQTLRDLEAEFSERGGRGVELADAIDRLRRYEDSQSGSTDGAS